MKRRRSVSFGNMCGENGYEDVIDFECNDINPPTRKVAKKISASEALDEFDFYPLDPLYPMSPIDFNISFSDLPMIDWSFLEDSEESDELSFSI